MDQRKRIAIYGGTFDPVHSGHLEVARKVSELFAIDEFLFVPARVAPHKVDREVSSALHRYAMLVLATQKDPRLLVSSVELDSPGSQFTVDTIFHFRSVLGARADIFFVMGADSWVEFTTWHDWQRLLTLTNLIVVTRPGCESPPENVAGAENVIDVRGWTKASIRSLAESGEPTAAGQTRIFITDVVMCDISASEVRWSAGEDRNGQLDRLVPLEVADYIRKYRLYRNTNEA
jgi:nicotinate-nucleotide adenylyltransferase